MTFRMINMWICLFFVAATPLISVAKELEAQRFTDAQGVEMVYPHSAKLRVTEAAPSSLPQKARSERGTHTPLSVAKERVIDGFSRVSHEVQASRDSIRQTILKKELAQEEKILRDKKQSIDKAESQTSRSSDYLLDIARHERNIQLLNYELRHIGNLAASLAGVGR